MPKKKEMEAIEYPLEAALAQVETMLDLAINLIRIEKICRIRRQK